MFAEQHAQQCCAEHVIVKRQPVTWHHSPVRQAPVKWDVVAALWWAKARCSTLQGIALLHSIRQGHTGQSVPYDALDAGGLLVVYNTAKR